MRYQVVVLASELGSAIRIDELSFQRAVGGEPVATFNDFKMYMGLGAGDQLTTDYMANYISGTRTQVLAASPYSNGAANPNDWFDVVLDSPYWYNGQDNLIIEVEWSSGAGSLYNWQWNGGSDRCVIGAYGASTGSSTESLVPHLILNGTLSLESSTFGAIKAAF
jgi:hypothetical protein